MANKLFDLAVKTREYTDTNGNKKAVWLNIGSQFDGKDGKPFIVLHPYINLAGIPRKDGSDGIIVSMFAPKQKKDNSQQNSYSPEPYDPNIPF